VALNAMIERCMTLARVGDEASRREIVEVVRLADGLIATARINCDLSYGEIATQLPTSTACVSRHDGRRDRGDDVHRAAAVVAAIDPRWQP